MRNRTTTAVRYPTWRSLAGATAATLLFSAMLVASAGAQVNGARLGIGPTMPTSTTVGAKGVGVFISLTNLSEPTDGKINIPKDAITFTPSCGALPGGGDRSGRHRLCGPDLRHCPELRRHGRGEVHRAADHPQGQ
jgi:hypothetical protein